MSNEPSSSAEPPRNESSSGDFEPLAFESSTLEPSAGSAAASNDLPTSELGRVGESEESIDWSVASSSDANLLARSGGGKPKRAAPFGDEIPERIGDYEIKGVIGSGGMGQVFLAEHVRMQRRVALKVLRSDRMGDSAALDRFYDEVRAASRVMHPNTVTAFDAGDFEGIHFLVMEYVEGVTLTKLVAKNGPLSPGMASSIIRQAALGLLHAHRNGIVHRDVKPGNLIRSVDGTIKVLDLGLAQISNVLWSEDGREIGRVQDPGNYYKRKGKLVGTLAYMSPEQLETPDDVDPRSDIYSLGAVLFFLLAGKPPFPGEYLDQVYGHRHGEIPDLMQIRSDVDLGLSNIVRRMLAKRLSERYASLDEVIEDLGVYAEESHGPTWLTQFVNRQASGDASTLSGGSTAISNLPVFGLDLGMTYIAAAEAMPGVGIHNLTAGSDGQPLFRMAIASEEERVLFDVDANQMRFHSPRQVVHCLPMYIGRELVGREVNGRQCPPEVLMALMVRRVIANARNGQDAPKLAAVTVPASYDQLHRRSVKQACRLAGLDSVRLVDRGIAAVQSLMLESDAELPSENVPIEPNANETILFLGVTGQATEVALIKRDGLQLTQLATAGHWHTGMLSWQHRLVELAAAAFRERHGFDPTSDTITASRLQMSCERAMNSLLLLPEVTVTVDGEQQQWSITVSRQAWLDRCGDLIYGVRKNMHDVCYLAGVHPKKIDSCVTLGPLLRIGELRERLFKKLPPRMTVRVVDRSDVARGAAACLSAELPQRSDVVLPPRCVAGQTIGIVVEDNQNRRRILPIIRRGEKLPARTNRKLTIAKNRDSMTLSVVESSGVSGEQWHSLGRYQFDVDKDSNNQLKRTRLIGFELSVDGLLTVRAQTPGTPESRRLPIIPDPTLPTTEEAGWQRWMKTAEG